MRSFVPMDALLAAADAAAPAAPAYARLTPEQRYSIIAYKKDSKKAIWIAEKLSIHRNTVRDVWKRYEATGSPLSGKRSGRPQLTDHATKAVIIDEVKERPFTSPKKVKRKLELGVSRQTIDRILKVAGLHGRVAQRKRDYTDAERRKRLSFAEGYAHMTEVDWEKVIFSDEKTFYGNGFCGRIWVRREVGEALNPKYCVHKVPHPPKLGMWGCFSAAGPGFIRTYNENMDAKMMEDVLDENLLATVQEHKLDNGQWYFLHDNAPTFKNGRVAAWLHNNGITCLELPPYSPDLNPIENLWAWFAARLDVKNLETMERLQDAIAEMWEEFRESEEALHVMRKLVHSMPARCKAVRDADGWHTKY